MSWTGIKKAINRAGTQVMVKTGHIDETIDQEYEFELKRFKNMETNSQKLHKELKHYFESLKILNTAQTNITEVLSEFYGANNTLEEKKYQNFAELYYQSTQDFQAQALDELQQPYHQTVLNPISRFNSYYIEINEAIKKRNNKKLDYDAMKSKVKKLVEKPEATAEYETKLNDSLAALAESEQLYDEINTKLKVELPKLINLRIPYLDPSFESFVKLQLRYFNENYRHLQTLEQKLDASTREDYVHATLDRRLDSVLDKMKELNITG